MDHIGAKCAGWVHRGTRHWTKHVGQYGNRGSNKEGNGDVAFGFDHNPKVDPINTQVMKISIATPTVKLISEAIWVGPAPLSMNAATQAPANCAAM